MFLHLDWIDSLKPTKELTRNEIVQEFPLNLTSNFDFHMILSGGLSLIIIMVFTNILN